MRTKIATESNAERQVAGDPQDERDDQKQSEAPPPCPGSVSFVLSFSESSALWAIGGGTSERLGKRRRGSRVEAAGWLAGPGPLPARCLISWPD